MKTLNLLLLAALLTACDGGVDPDTDTDEFWLEDTGAEDDEEAPPPAPQNALIWLDGDGTPVLSGGSPGGVWDGNVKQTGMAINAADADGIIWRVDVVTGQGHPTSGQPAGAYYTGAGCTGDGYITAVTAPGMTFIYTNVDPKTLHYIDAGTTVLTPDGTVEFFSLKGQGVCMEIPNGARNGSGLNVAGWYPESFLRDTGEEYNQHVGVDLGLVPPLRLGVPK